LIANGRQTKKCWLLARANTTGRISVRHVGPCVHGTRHCPPSKFPAAVKALASGGGKSEYFTQCSLFLSLRNRPMRILLANLGLYVGCRGHFDRPSNDGGHCRTSVLARVFRPLPVLSETFLCVEREFSFLSHYFQVD